MEFIQIILKLAPGQNILTISSLEKLNILSNNAFLERGKIFIVFISCSINGAGKAFMIVVMGFCNGAPGSELQVKWFQVN